MRGSRNGDIKEISAVISLTVAGNTRQKNITQDEFILEDTKNNAFYIID